MDNMPVCPQCGENYTYVDGELYVCPMCAHEWSNKVVEESVKEYRDCNGNILVDGDSVTVIKDLKINGSSSVVKRGTKVKNIRFSDGDHDISCKIDGLGAMELKTEFVKKI